MKKTIQSLVAAVLVLSLVAGCAGNIAWGKTASAASAKIKIKEPDFTLKLPASWKNNYVVLKSKSKKHGSYVTFSSKLCAKTGDGHLFSIFRYKDNSYTSDVPSHELVGKWNGYNYVAGFPTEIQTYNASKKAKKQYMKLAGDVYDVLDTIRPVKKKRTGKDIYHAADFSLKLPKSWANNYIVKKGGKKKNAYVAFYAKKCYNQRKEGFVFSIAKFTDESYRELPSYELVGKWNGYNYVAEYPTDVQYEGASKAAVKQYRMLEKTAVKAARSIEP